MFNDMLAMGAGGEENNKRLKYVSTTSKDAYPSGGSFTIDPINFYSFSGSNGYQNYFRYIWQDGKWYEDAYDMSHSYPITLTFSSDGTQVSFSASNAYFPMSIECFEWVQK